MAVRALNGLIPIDPPDYLEWFDLSSRPLLELAKRDAAPAHSVRVEWIAERFEDGKLKRRVLSNYTQILRQPFRREWLKEVGRHETMAEAAKRAGDQILDSAEMTLWYGKPSYDPAPISTAGGVLHFLRRRMYENDTVRLRELRPLTLYLSRGLTDEFREEEFHTHEWLWEFSLQINPGHYQRGMRPLFLPPPFKPVRAWAQGASLEQES